MYAFFFLYKVLIYRGFLFIITHVIEASIEESLSWGPIQHLENVLHINGYLQSASKTTQTWSLVYVWDTFFYKEFIRASYILNLILKHMWSSLIFYFQSKNFKSILGFDSWAHHPNPISTNTRLD